jgi:hypothetical protein
MCERFWTLPRRIGFAAQAAMSAARRQPLFVFDAFARQDPPWMTVPN